MIQLQLINGKTAGTQYVARRFPVQLGRARDTHFPLDEPGVWDRHAEITLEPDNIFVVRATAQGRLAVNGEPAEEKSLRNGDVIELGSAQLRFSLSPTQHRSVRPREVLTWVAIGILCLLQIAIIYALG